MRIAKMIYLKFEKEKKYYWIYIKDNYSHYYYYYYYYIKTEISKKQEGKQEEDSTGEHCFLNLFLFYCGSVMKSVIG